MEEEFDVNRYDKWLNVSGREERANERFGQGFGTRTYVCRLADLASRLILSFRVGMDWALGDEQDEQHREGKSQYPR